MISDRPRPLPECALCQQPTQRRVHRVNRGLCTPCRQTYDQTHAEQQQIPLVTSAPTPRPPDLTNVVVLDMRRRTP